MVFQLNCSALAEYPEYTKLENVHKHFVMDKNKLAEQS